NTANAQTLLGLVLSGSKNSKMWTDATEVQKFLFGITMMRALLPGIPLFPSGDAFVNGMKGQMAQTLGITPVQFDAEDRMKKAVTPKSRVSIIYSSAVVPGSQRKTRVRIHTVVDFRSAPAPSAAPTPTGTSTSGTPTPPPQPPTTTTGAAAGALDPITL